MAVPRAVSASEGKQAAGLMGCWVEQVCWSADGRSICAGAGRAAVVAAVERPKGVETDQIVTAEVAHG